jgi:hypothetical protein
MSLTKVTFAMIEGIPFNVLDYGADPTGVADSTQAIKDALTAGGSNCAIYLPTGTYKVTSEILVSQDRVHIYGDGVYATTIQFAPTANSTCFRFERSGSTINQGSIRDIAFRSNDNTYVKTALHFVDLSGYYITNIVIGGGVAIGNSGFWTDPTYSSRGIYIQGRDSTGFNEITSFADKPIVVDVNPNDGGIQISIDHMNFNNLYLGATFNPCVTFEAGVVATQVSFTGFQAWVLGEGGFYWVGTDSTIGASNGLSFENVRYENNRDQSTYFIHIDSAAGVQNVQVSGGQFGFTNGFYLRGINQIALNSVYYSVPGTSGVAMNANTSVNEINTNGCYWASTSTASLTGLQVQHQEATWTSGPLPGTGQILAAIANSGSYNEIFTSTLGSTTYVLAASAVIGIGKNTQVGHIFFATRDYTTAIYALNGLNASTIEINDPSGLFSTTAGTADSYNIYWSSANSRYELENGFAVSKTLNYFRTGAGQ